jgi:hypothetical protein
LVLAVGQELLGVPEVAPFGGIVVVDGDYVGQLWRHFDNMAKMLRQPPTRSSTNAMAKRRSSRKRPIGCLNIDE